MYRTLLVTMLLFILSCGEEIVDTKSPVCRRSPESLDFGVVLTPPFGWIEDYRTLDLIIANDGTAELRGSVSISVEPTGPRAARFHLTPEQTDPNFRVDPGDSITFTIGVTMENASDGDYSGWLHLGTGCDSVPISLEAFPSQ